MTIVEPKGLCDPPRGRCLVTVPFGTSDTTNEGTTLKSCDERREVASSWDFPTTGSTLTYPVE